MSGKHEVAKGSREAALARVDSLSLDQLAKHANAAAREVESQALYHACVSGIFLIAARAKCEKEGTGWYAWLDEEWHHSRQHADRYVTLAEACKRDPSRVAKLEAKSIRGALSVLGRPVDGRKSESAPRKQPQGKDGDRSRVSGADSPAPKVIDLSGDDAKVTDAGRAELPAYASPPGKLPRGRCPTCHVEVAVRVTGDVREHRSDSGTSMCAGGKAIFPDAPQLPAVVEDQDDAAMPDVQGPPDEEDRSAEQDVDDLDDTPEGDPNDGDDGVLCDVCGVELVEIEGATCTPCVNKAAGVHADPRPAAGAQGVPAPASTVEPDACAGCGHAYALHAHPSHYPGVLRCEADDCRCEHYRPTVAWLEHLAATRRGRLMTSGEAEILAADNAALRADLDAFKAQGAPASHAASTVPALPTTPVLLLAAPGTGLGASQAAPSSATEPPPSALLFLEALEASTRSADVVPEAPTLAQLRAAQGLALLVEAGIYRLQAKEGLRAVPGRPDPWGLDDEIDKLVCKLAKRFSDDDGVVLKTLRGAVAGGPPVLPSYHQGLDLVRRPTSTDLIRTQVLDETHPFLRPAMRSSSAASPEQTALLLVRDLWSRIDGLVGALKTVRVSSRRVDGLSALRDQLEPAIDAATALVRAQHGQDAPEPKPAKAGGKKKAKGKKGEGAEKDEEVADGE